MISDVRKGDYTDPHAAKTYLKAVFEDWVATENSLKPKTKESYVSLWRCLIEPEWARRPIASINRAEVRKWISEGRSISGRKVSASRIRQAAILLKKLLDHSVELGLLNRNAISPLKGLLPKIENQKPKRALEMDELLRLADACGEYRLMILLAGLTGLRWAELIALEAEDFDFKSKKIVVNKSLSEVNGSFYAVSTKSGKSRDLPIPDYLLQELRQVVLASAKGKPVFSSKEGGLLRRANFTKRVFAPALEKANLSGVRIHDLRHTAVSHQLRAGANLLAISKIAGHSKPSTTLNIYAHELDDSLDTIRSTIDEMLTGSSCDRFVTDSDIQTA
jgi:integrase